MVRYVISGFLSTAANIGVFYALFVLFGVWYIFSSIVAFCAALTVGFLLHAFWTFGQSVGATNGKQFILFTGVACINLLLNIVIVAVCVEVLHIWALFAQLFAGFCIAVWNFFIMKYQIFNTQK